MKAPDRPALAELIATFRGNWPQLLAIHLLVAVLSFIALTPLLGLLIKAVVRLSGQAALTDQDILFFALTPLGLGGILVIAAVFFFIVVAEHGALVISNWQYQNREPLSLFAIGALLANRLTLVLQLALRMMARALMVAMPFILIAGAVFWWKLTEFDINYYLQEKPPEFLIAAAMIVPLLLIMAFFLLRLFVGWTLALPLILINGESPAAALEHSTRAVAPHRRAVFTWLGVWLAIGLVMAMLTALIVTWLTEVSIATTADSLARLGVALALVLVLGLLLNTGVLFIDASLLSLVILRVHRDTGLAQGAQVANTSSAGAMGVPRISRGGVAGLLVAGAVAAGAAGYLMLERVSGDDATLVTAHRGASAHAPENTMASIELAAVEGAEWVEIDVQETADGQILVIHDRDLMKIAGNPMVVGDSAASDLQQVDIGTWFDPSFSDQRMLTLLEVLEAVRGRSKLNIELKYYGHERRLEAAVVEIVEQAGMVDEVVIMSLSYPGIQEMRRLRPDWTIGLLSSVALGDITRLDADFFAVNARFAGRSFIKRAHEAGKKVLVWTVNDPLTMCVMANRGVDSIITDEPAMARSVLAQRAELGNFERVLLNVAALIGHEIPAIDQ